LAKSGAEKMLEESLKTGLREGFIKKAELNRVNVDSTVQEKAVRYPTDARLYDRMRERLVKSARKNGVELRQTYERIDKKVLRSQSGYAKASQFKRARKATKQLKTFLGRVVRDIERKITAPDIELQHLLEMGNQLLAQKRTDKKKLYSIHEPQVECIGKGKAHKKFEFGTKVGLVTSAKSNWIVGAEAYPGNPYDGHTLKSALAQTTKILGFEPAMAICDLGYRGNNYEGECNIQVVNRFRKRVSRSLCHWWNRRSAIEPVIGHCKSEHRMDRNLLRGQLGDELNVIFAAAGFNFQKLLRAFALFLCLFFRLVFLQLEKYEPKRFEKGRAREGKDFSSKVFFCSHQAFA
jgi:transposase IS4 family protein